MITHLLFDLDNTLYSGKYGLENNVSARLEKFVSDYLHITREESEETHRDLIVNRGYGTTIEWLIAEKGFTDIDSYYKTINPDNEADSLPPDPGLGKFLSSIPLPKAVLSNSIMSHIDLILDKLGIADLFDYKFDIKLNNFRGKPHRDAFFKALEKMNAKPETTLFIDDYPEFIAGFLKIGGKGLLYDEFSRHNDLSYERIKDLREIEKYI